MRSYVDKPFKTPDDLDRAFSLGQDLDYVIPLAKVAVAANSEIEFLASPWSPPAWAKTNRSMKSGGKLKSRYSEQWARIIAHAVHKYRNLGIPITRLTAQNEPCASQTWESCLFDAKSEAEFICKSLKPALLAAGLDDVKILAWDHNKEHLLDRAVAFADRPEWLDAIDGFAFHWYSGDHFEALDAAHRFLGKDFELVFSEGCDAYSAGRSEDELPHAEHYAREIIGDLESGANAVFDWNVLLDMQGGPNHVGNFCDAPIMYDLDSEEMRIRLPFHYIGHFSRFIPPKSKRILSSSYTRDLETTACTRPDGSISTVILNRTDRDVGFSLAFGKADEQIKDLCAPSHSIQTIVVC